MRLTQWMYILVLLLPAILRLAEKLLSQTGGIASRYGPLMAMGLLAIGYIVAARRSPVVNRVFWRCSFWLLSALLSLTGVYGFILLAFASNITAGAVLLLTAVIAIPALSSLYRYSSVSNTIWDNNL
ncbi:hypothetical protein [Alteromonas alba]|nr:hypothetical protein [Alteromonas alba]|tara:strand:- start:6455 stop:6835 length:381 start_codon:yes stop_codon:yes gene_type:complete